jgi:hypothetical protein
MGVKILGVKKWVIGLNIINAILAVIASAYQTTGIKKQTKKAATAATVVITSIGVLGIFLSQVQTNEILKANKKN